ncbi:hypothetical protein Poly59_49840 [Rubripirellula reticaptiva]|uniref:Uncharacterized protein n=1 Tax=Rubripirellula reticaptiva TaxID=2528013 RepID=A0A5C6EH51_9BACT|nr:hypothetical protein Poly59_49840 [Rubripirellula reticaptiva]
MQTRCNGLCQAVEGWWDTPVATFRKVVPVVEILRDLALPFLPSESICFAAHDDRSSFRVPFCREILSNQSVPSRFPP